MQIANRMRRLHRRNHTKLCKAREIHWINNLRVLDSPAWVCDFALSLRHCFEGFLIFVQRESVREISDGVRLDLNPRFQSPS
jgi:hypothetical protein